MAADKGSAVISELSPAGGLKMTIRREKPPVSASSATMNTGAASTTAVNTEWITETRGNGIGKLVLKRRNGTANATPSPEVAHRLAVKKPSPGPRNILRLSFTPNSNDGGVVAQIKNFPCYESASALMGEDVASGSEMSPACHLQPSPKDSGIDISSPPRDDGHLTASILGSDASEEVRVAAADRTVSLLSVSDYHNTDCIQPSDVTANESLDTHCNFFDSLTPGVKWDSSKVQSTLRTKAERSADIVQCSKKPFKTVSKLKVSGHKLSDSVESSDVASWASSNNKQSVVKRERKRSSAEESATYNVAKSSRKKPAKTVERVVLRLKQGDGGKKLQIMNAGNASMCVNQKKVKIEGNAGTKLRFKCCSHADANIKQPQYVVEVADKTDEYKDCVDLSNAIPEAQASRKRRCSEKQSCKTKRIDVKRARLASAFVVKQVVAENKEVAAGDDDGLLKYSTKLSLTVAEGLNAEKTTVGQSSADQCSTYETLLPSETKSPVLYEGCSINERDICSLEVSSDNVDVGKGSSNATEELRSGVQSASCSAFASNESSANEVLAVDWNFSCKSIATSEVKDTDYVDSIPAVRAEKDAPHSLVSRHDACMELTSADCGGILPPVVLDCSSHHSMLRNTQAVGKKARAFGLQHCDPGGLPVETKPHIIREKVELLSKTKKESNEVGRVFPFIKNRAKQHVEMNTTLPFEGTCSDAKQELNTECVISSADAQHEQHVTSGENLLAVPNSSSEIDRAHVNRVRDVCFPNIFQDQDSCTNSLVDQVCRTKVCTSASDHVAVALSMDTCTEFEVSQVPKSDGFSNSLWFTASTMKHHDDASGLTKVTEQLPAALPADGVQQCSVLSPVTSSPAAVPCLMNTFMTEFTKFIHTQDTETELESKAKQNIDNGVELQNNNDSCLALDCRLTDEWTFQGNAVINTSHIEHPKKSADEKVNRNISHKRELARDRWRSKKLYSNCAYCRRRCFRPSGSLDIARCVSGYQQLISLRHKVCDLLDAVLPSVEYPSGFNRDTPSVERFVDQILQILTSQERTDSDSYCSEPVVEICCSPDQCTDIFRRKILRLLAALLPDVDLPDIADNDSIEVLLELLTAENQQLSSSVSRSEMDRNSVNVLSPAVLFSSVPGARISLGTSSLSVHPTEAKLSVSHSPLLTPNSFGAMATSSCSFIDKKSLKRQVKDLLSFLDKDLT